MENLIKKYDVAGPRYTSYPAVPFWNGTPSQENWISHIKSNYNDEQGIDLYIHIPYCVKLCYYCGCNRSITKDLDKGGAYTEQLLKEWSLYLLKVGKDIKISSLHFGGGTPTFLKPVYMDRLLNVLSKSFKEDFTGSIEVDPRTCDEEHLQVLQKYRFKRISMGIQDFDLTVQTAINRVQPYELVETLVKKVWKYEFTSLNFDLIFGLPHQTVSSIEDTIHKVMKLKPSIIAFYSYAHLPDRLKNQKLIDETALPHGPEKRLLYTTGKALLESLGYNEIGMDHFALEGSYLSDVHKDKKLLRNFMGYTDKKSNIMLGIGLTSISNTPNSFAQNSKDLKEYTSLLEKDQIPLFNGHTMNEEDRIVEDIVQNIMCNGVVELSKAKDLDLRDTIKDELSKMSEDGLINLKENGDYNVTSVGHVFLRNIAMSFDSHLRAKKNAAKFSRTV